MDGEGSTPVGRADDYGMMQSLTRSNTNGRYCNEFAWLFFADYVQRYVGETGKAELAGGGWGNVNHPPTGEGPTVVYAYHNRAAVAAIGDAHHGSEWERSVRGCQLRRACGFATCSPAGVIRIDGRNAGFA
jgi:hypothetical protein